MSVANGVSMRNPGPESLQAPVCADLRRRLQAARTPYPNRRRLDRKASGRDIGNGNPHQENKGKRQRKNDERKTTNHEWTRMDTNRQEEPLAKYRLHHARESSKAPVSAYHSPLEGESGEARLRAGGGPTRRPVSEIQRWVGGAGIAPPPHQPSPFGSTSATPPQGGSDTRVS